MVALSIFSKIFQQSFSLTDISTYLSAFKENVFFSNFTNHND